MHTSEWTPLSPEEKLGLLNIERAKQGLPPLERYYSKAERKARGLSSYNTFKSPQSAGCNTSGGKPPSETIAEIALRAYGKRVLGHMVFITMCFI